jgi:hypothetical protein
MSICTRSSILRRICRLLRQFFNAIGRNQPNRWHLRRGDPLNQNAPQFNYWLVALNDSQSARCAVRLRNKFSPPPDLCAEDQPNKSPPLCDAKAAGIVVRIAVQDFGSPARASNPQRRDQKLPAAGFADLLHPRQSSRSRQDKSFQLRQEITHVSAEKYNNKSPSTTPSPPLRADQAQPNSASSSTHCLTAADEFRAAAAPSNRADCQKHPPQAGSAACWASAPNHPQTFAHTTTPEPPRLSRSSPNHRPRSVQTGVCPAASTSACHQQNTAHPSDVTCDVAQLVLGLTIL